jgi:hypothetical protein
MTTEEQGNVAQAMALMLDARIAKHQETLARTSERRKRLVREAERLARRRLTVETEHGEAQAALHEAQRLRLALRPHLPKQEQEGITE